MTNIQQRIYSNGNWRADSGKTSSEVADEMNASRIVLINGSNYTLLGLQEKLGQEFTALVEYAILAAIKSIEALPDAPENIPAKIQGIGLKQTLDSLRIGNGPDFGLLQTQTALDLLAPVLDQVNPNAVTILKDLGRTYAGEVVTATDVENTWTWLANRFAKENRIAFLQQKANELMNILSSEADDSTIVNSIKTEIAGW